MAAHSGTAGSSAGAAVSPNYAAFAGVCALLAGITGFLYSVAFVAVTLQPDFENPGVLLYSVLLLIGGLATSAVMLALYSLLRAVDPLFALWGAVLGLSGALGSVIHAGFDLANAINPPASNPLNAANLPSLVDPRSLLTFGLGGLAIIVLSWLITRSDALPRRLGTLGYVLGVLLVLLYVGRLTLLDPRNPALLVVAALAGFIVSPAWYIWLGLTLRRLR